jgi:hypothetical protein
MVKQGNRVLVDNGSQEQSRLGVSSWRLFVLSLLCALVIIVLPSWIKKTLQSGRFYGQDSISVFGTGSRSRTLEGALPYVKAGQTIVIDYKVTIQEGTVNIAVYRTEPVRREAGVNCNRAPQVLCASR